MQDVIVIGGGVIGLSAARELSRQGRSVLVLDRGNSQDAATWAAAGMIAPQSEAAEPHPFFDLCLASARLYPEWTSRLAEESGIDPEYETPGLLFVASTEESFCRLKRNMEWQRAAGLSSELLSAKEAAGMEPQLTLPLTGAVWMPAEHQVTPRRLVDALRGACAPRQVEIRRGVRVVEVLRDGDRAAGVRTTEERLESGHVIVASGAWSSGISGLQPAIPITPRKGQILSLRPPAQAFRRMIRWEHVYFVPRRNGELVVGATNEDAGFDRSLTPDGIGGLLNRARELSAHAGGYPIAEMWSGLRPASPDGLPVIGKSGLEGLIYATGHYRNGILLAPVTAQAVAALIDGGPLPVSLDPFAPSRFAV